MFTWGPQSASDSDPLFQYVALLLRYEGADGSTAVLDSSINADHKTCNAGQVISTAQARHGGSSLLVSHRGPDGLIWTGSRFGRASGTEACFETWFEPVSHVNATANPFLMTLYDQFGALMFYVSKYRENGFDQVEFRVAGNAAQQHTYTLDGNGQVHIAVTIDSSDNCKLWLGGTGIRQEAVGASSGALCSFYVAGTTASSTTPIECYLDETRATLGPGGSGCVRYTGDFTPSPLPWPGA